jgi:Holliday junction DNA helicase RuvA
MIGQIRGQLLDKRPPWLMVEAAGVGYEIEAPMTVFYGLPEPGAEVVLHTHMVVREDAQLLYGFSDRFERELFRALIRISGVGPKLALSILSGMESDRLVMAIRQQDAAALVKIPGIGKKTAERLVIEMSDRLDKLDGAPADLPGAVPGAGAAVDQPLQDAVAALEALGYKARDAADAVRRVATDEPTSSEALIRAALKALAR